MHFLRCGQDHVWGEFGGEEGEDKVVHLEEHLLLADDQDASLAVLADNTTKATYSVMFYYTPTFASITTDIDGFIDQVLAETNQGYLNSGVALEAVRLCAKYYF